MSIEFKIYDGRIRCEERFKILKNIIKDNEMDKEDRKCLLILDEAIIRIGDNQTGSVNKKVFSWVYGRWTENFDHATDEI
jgi:hypothetical protein